MGSYDTLAATRYDSMEEKAAAMAETRALELLEIVVRDVGVLSTSDTIAVAAAYGAIAQSLRMRIAAMKSDESIRVE